LLQEITIKTRAIAEARIKYDKFDTVIGVRRYSQMNEKGTAVMCNDSNYTTRLIQPRIANSLWKPHIVTSLQLLFSFSNSIGGATFLISAGVIFAVSVMSFRLLKMK
jgi:hypothetical protein